VSKTGFDHPCRGITGVSRKIEQEILRNNSLQYHQSPCLLGFNKEKTDYFEYFGGRESSLIRIDPFYVRYRPFAHSG
jgi:hypothetical protein